jgi:hypothetical protein
MATRTATKVGGFVFGMLSSSPALLANAKVDYASYARKLKWVAWNESMAPARGLFGTVFGTEGRVSIMLGAVHAAAATSRTPMLQSLDIAAHFAIADGRFVPFYVSNFRAAAPGRPGTASPPVTFDALVPDRMALTLEYALDAKSVGSTVATTGSVYLPVGSTTGPGTGIYVLAGPSHTSGLPPNLSTFVFSGDPRAPIVDARGRSPDFDHITLSIHKA